MTSRPAPPPMPKIPQTEATHAEPESFEAAMAELETLVQSLEQAGLSLEVQLQGYQRGMVLSQFCKKKLSHVQGEVERLSSAAEKPTEEGQS